MIATPCMWPACAIAPTTINSVVLPVSFLGRGVIDVPMSKIVDYIHKFHSRLEWDDFAIVCS